MVKGLSACQHRGEQPERTASLLNCGTTGDYLTAGYRAALPPCPAFPQVLTAVTVSLMKSEPEEKPSNLVGFSAASGAQDPGLLLARLLAMLAG